MVPGDPPSSKPPCTPRQPFPHQITPLLSVLNPTNGELLAKVSEGTAEDVNLAVAAAQRAFDTTWGHNTPGSVRGILLNKLADKMESQYDALCAVEALDNGLVSSSNLI
jgi:acyl-CoA reductase-like NAD-dependent aldehyde dehydrogenase